MVTTATLALSGHKGQIRAFWFGAYFSYYRYYGVFAWFSCIRGVSKELFACIIRNFGRYWL